MASGDAADDVRFLHVSSDETSRFIDAMKNNNTKMKTKSDMKILSETNTSRSVNNPTPHIDMNEDQSEFPNDDYIFNNIDLDNVVQAIENFESNIGEKNVKINSGNSSKFSILPYASIGNVTINIYGSEK
jgi:hypothetical protein